MKYEELENERLEREEQAIGEPQGSIKLGNKVMYPKDGVMYEHKPMNVLEQEEEDRFTQEKIRENADSELNDLREEDASFGERE